MIRAISISILLEIVISGCSSQQLYHTGQAWRSSLCDKAMGDDRARCRADASKSYADYRRETTATNTSK